MAKFALLLEHRKAFEAFECNKKYHIFLGEKITDITVFKAASRLSDDVNFHQSDRVISHSSWDGQTCSNKARENFMAFDDTGKGVVNMTDLTRAFDLMDKVFYKWYVWKIL